MIGKTDGNKWELDPAAVIIRADRMTTSPISLQRSSLSLALASRCVVDRVSWARNMLVRKFIIGTVGPSQALAPALSNGAVHFCITPDRCSTSRGVGFSSGHR